MNHTQPIFLSLFLVLLSACSTLEKPFYYKAEKDNKKLHILGTAHVGFGIRELPNYIVNDLEKDRGFAGEMNTIITKEKEKTYYEKYLKRQKIRFDWNRAKKTKTNGVFTPEEWTLITNKMDTHFKDQKILDKEEYSYWPIYFIKTFASPRNVKVYVSHAQKFGLMEKLDFQIYEKVTDLNKVQMPLDTEFVVSDECSDQADTLFIKRVIRLTDDEYGEYVKATLDQLFMAYESGEETQIIDFLKDDFDPQVAQCLMIERNQRWVELIDEAKSEFFPLFVAVGVGHLVGKDSLLELLRAKGYSVRRVEQR